MTSNSSFLWPFLREHCWCALAALAINTSAYASEIIRGGLLSVRRGELEAAYACRMSSMLILRRIILPVAIRQALSNCSRTPSHCSICCVVMYAPGATQKGLPVIPADKYANFRMKRSALLASPMRCSCYRWVGIYWRGRWSRVHSTRDATTICRR
ncbi:ABC transporter permease subunit [Caballeronia mineralivorans]|uniref:ABC transporter permease subunit n=1 Tax=Caballeronia mineralivorans TaxID=2010198 RepID=UPI002B0018AC|nr:ABC transporter permease subunit [Caballeronia mineralivorans]